MMSRCKMELFLGIDTSCYTTSLAIVDGEGNLFSEARKLLAPPPGGRGLAQNEAVFQHILNLPGLFTEVAGPGEMHMLRGIAASVRPRPVEGSYMPVFMVAKSFAASLAGILGIPLVLTSHQEGHLAAGLWSAGGPTEDEFLAVHLSGGTTELLHVKVGHHLDEANRFFEIKLIGGSTDLHAGQFVDRIGVSLGLPFPAGPHLELLAQSASTEVAIPSSVKGFDLSFSGPEAAALRLVEKGVPAPDVARAVENCIANTMEKVIRKAVLETGIKAVLIVGGVSANNHVREKLCQRLHHQAVKARLHFATPRLSSDNSVGVALIGRSKHCGVE